MAIDPKLLEILVCPKCRDALEYDASEQSLTCLRCRLRYRIEDDIPVMLIDEAEAI